MVIEVDERNFQKEVLHSRQPVSLSFWADSCASVMPVIEELALEFSNRMKFGKVHVERSPSLTRLCFIETLPTTLYFADGLVRDRIVGVDNRAAMVLRLEALLAKSWNALSLPSAS